MAKKNKGNGGKGKKGKKDKKGEAKAKVETEIDSGSTTNVAEALSSIAKAVEDLKGATGVNQRAVIALLHDHTKLPKKVIRTVLEGTIEALAKYTAQGDQAEDDSED